MPATVVRAGVAVFAAICVVRPTRPMPDTADTARPLFLKH